MGSTERPFSGAPSKPSERLSLQSWFCLVTLFSTFPVLPEFKTIGELRQFMDLFITSVFYLETIHKLKLIIKAGE